MKVDDVSDIYWCTIRSKNQRNQMNTFTLHSNGNTASKTVHIDAPASKIWDALTRPALMNQWMMPDSKMDIITDWQVGSPLIIRGNLHGINFDSLKPKKFLNTTI